MRLSLSLAALLLTATAAWLCGAMPAAAAQGSLVSSPTFVPEAGPVLAGDGGLAWIRRRDDAVLELWVAEPGSGARRIQRFAGSDTEDLRSPRLSASSTTVGLELFEVSQRRGSRAPVVASRTYLGAFGEPLTQVGGCAVADQRVRSIDVGEGIAAFRGHGCRPTTLRSPATESALAAGAYGTRVAGRFDAWLQGRTASGDPRTAVVRDGSNGAIAEHALRAGLVDQSLHADGTLALSYGTRLAILGPGATAAHTLGLELLAPETVRWVGDALGVVAAGEHGRGVLQVVDRAGATVRRIVDLGRDRELARHADIGALQAVWVARGCRSAQIRTVALPVAPTVEQREPTCRLRLRERARLVGERLRLGVSCAGFAIGCAARVVVHAGGRAIARGVATYNHATPPFAAANLRVSAPGMRLLRRKGRTRVRIGAIFDEDEFGPPPSMRTRRATHTVVITRNAR